MKISAKQKSLNKQKLIRAAVKTISERGFDETSLREISIAAGMSEPVIYKYFANKQAVLFEYLLESVREAVRTVAGISRVEDLPFGEQIQLLIETHFDTLNRDQKFVEKIFPLVFVTGLSTAQEALKPCRELFATFVDQCLEEAIKAGELVAPPFRETLVSMFWDFHVGLLQYSLNDDSEMKTNTSELTQKSLAIITEVLKSGLLARLGEMAYFLIRTHLLTPSLKGPPRATPAKSRPRAWDQEI